MLLSIGSAFAGQSMSQKENVDKVTNMDKAHTITLHGLLNKEITVSYLSPYSLTTEDDQNYEIRGSNLVSESHLEELVGQKVELQGRLVIIPSEKAPEGSEAHSRFVGGMIPEIKYFEVLKIQ